MLSFPSLPLNIGTCCSFCERTGRNHMQPSSLCSPYPCHGSGGRGKTRAVPSTIQILNQLLWNRYITKKGRIAKDSFILAHYYYYCYYYYYYYYYGSFIPSFANSLCCWQGGCEGDGWKMCRGTGQCRGKLKGSDLVIWVSFAFKLRAQSRVVCYTTKWFVLWINPVHVLCPDVTYFSWWGVKGKGRREFAACQCSGPLGQATTVLALPGLLLVQGHRSPATADQQTPLWKCEVLTTQWSLTPNNFPDPLVFCVVFLEWLMPMVLQCFSYGKEQIKKSLLWARHVWASELGTCIGRLWYNYVLCLPIKHNEGLVAGLKFGKSLL